MVRTPGRGKRALPDSDSDGTKTSMGAAESHSRPRSQKRTVLFDDPPAGEGYSLDRIEAFFPRRFYTAITEPPLDKIAHNVVSTSLPLGSSGITSDLPQ